MCGETRGFWVQVFISVEGDSVTERLEGLSVEVHDADLFKALALCCAAVMNELAIEGQGFDDGSYYYHTDVPHTMGKRVFGVPNGIRAGHSVVKMGCFYSVLFGDGSAGNRSKAFNVCAEADTPHAAMVAAVGRFSTFALRLQGGGAVVSVDGIDGTGVASALDFGGEDG